MKFILVKLFR